MIYSISCTITCHDCPLTANNFNYFVTLDTLPKNLNNCTMVNTGDLCLMDIIWNPKSNMTQIGFSSGGDEKSIGIEHSLVTEVRLEKNSSDLIWTRGISYMCSTDKCNDLSELKRILDSLTLNDNLKDLEYLLKNDEPFDGNWCHFSTNDNSSECNIDIPPDTCEVCSFQGKSDHGPIRFCSNCFPFDIGERSISYEVDFNMIDRTRSDHWILECRFKSCNTYENGNMVLEKSVVKFDFKKFLDGNNRSTNLLSINKISLLFIVFFMKFLLN